MKKRKFAEGGALEELAEGKAKGSFDEDVYKRARAFLERGGEQEQAAEEKRTVRSVRPKVTDTGDESARMLRRAPAPTAPAAMGRAEIPGPMGAPSPGSRNVGKPSDESEPFLSEEVKRNIKNTAAALTPFGVSAAMRGAKGLGEAASAGWRAGRPAAALAKSTPRVGDEGLEALARSTAEKVPTPRVAIERFTPAQRREATESSIRGAANRKEIQAKRAARESQAGADRAASAKEDIVRRRSGAEYAKGGAVRGDGICQRGKTKGRFV